MIIANVAENIDSKHMKRQHMSSSLQSRNMLIIWNKFAIANSVSHFRKQNIEYEYTQAHLTYDYCTIKFHSKQYKEYHKDVYHLPAGQNEKCLLCRKEFHAMWWLPLKISREAKSGWAKKIITHWEASVPQPRLVFNQENNMNRHQKRLRDALQGRRISIPYKILTHQKKSLFI